MAGQKVIVTFGRDVTDEDLAALQAPDDVIEALLVDDTHINININTDFFPPHPVGDPVEER